MLTYSPWLLYCVVAVVLAQLVPLWAHLSVADVTVAVDASKAHVVSLWPLYLSVALLLALVVNRGSPSVFLVDFACSDPPKSWQVTHAGKTPFPPPRPPPPQSWMYMHMRAVCLVELTVCAAAMSSRKFAWGGGVSCSFFECSRCYPC